MPRATNNNTIGRGGALLLGLCACLAVLGGVTGCRGDRSEKPPRRFMPDMDYQPKWKPQSETEFFVDGQTQRQPVEGTIAFGSAGFDPGAYGDQAWASGAMSERESLLGGGSAAMTGRDGKGPEGWAAYMPIEVTPELVARGQNRFNIYCTSCHGYVGGGNGYAGGAFAGEVGKRWAYTPADLLGELYTDRAGKQGTDGWLFNVTRNGLWGPDGSNKMPAHGHALDAGDAWAVVSYVRALQASQRATIKSVPEAHKAELAGGGS